MIIFANLIIWPRYAPDAHRGQYGRTEVKRTQAVWYVNHMVTSVTLSRSENRVLARATLVSRQSVEMGSVNVNLGNTFWNLRMNKKQEKHIIGINYIQLHLITYVFL